MDPIGRALRRLTNMVLTGRISAIDDTGQIQTSQVTVDDLSQIDNVLTPHTYGFSSSAPIGSSVVLMTMNGNRAHAFAVTSTHGDSRITALPAGGIAMGTNLVNIIVDPGTGKMVINAPGGLVINGMVAVTQDLTVNSMTTPVNLGQHVHREHDSPLTSAPVVGT